MDDTINSILERIVGLAEEVRDMVEENDTIDFSTLVDSAREIENQLATLGDSIEGAVE